MEAITTWAKENYDLITLGVSILGTLIGVIGVIHEKKKSEAIQERLGNRSVIQTGIMHIFATKYQ